MKLKKQYDQYRLLYRISIIVMAILIFFITNIFVKEGTIETSMQILLYFILMYGYLRLTRNIIIKQIAKLEHESRMNFFHTLKIEDIDEYYNYLLLRAKDIEGKKGEVHVLKVAFIIHTFISKEPFPRLQVLLNQLQIDFEHSSANSLDVYEYQAHYYIYKGEYDKVLQIYKKRIELLEKCQEAGTLPQTFRDRYDLIIHSQNDMIRIIEEKDEDTFEENLHNRLKDAPLSKVMGAYADLKMAQDFGFTRSISTIKFLVEDIDGDIPWLQLIKEA